MLQGKVWGKTEQLLITPMIEVHRVHIDPHSYCSSINMNLNGICFM